MCSVHVLCVMCVCVGLFCGWCMLHGEQSALVINKQESE